jgi:site-specific recombinase XerD
LDKYEHIEEFFNHKRVYDNVSENTIINYRGDLRKFLDFTNGRINVYRGTFENFIKFLLDEEKESRKTINRRISAVKSFYNYLCDSEIIESNNAKRMKYLKEEPSKPKNILPQKDIFVMLDKINHVRDRALMETLYSTGVREGELSALNIDNIDFENELVAVIKGKGRK